jgi:uncharacterized repeat protein (TIGR02543 family)
MMYRKVAVLGAVAVMAAMMVGCGDKGTDKPPTPTTFTLSVSAVPPTGGEVAIDPELDKYDKGTPVSLIATPKAGFVFKHWSGAVSSADSSIVINMDSNVVVAANFAVVCSLTVTSSLEEGGEVSVSPNQKVFLSGDTVIVTATVKPGHKFIGWSGGSTSKNLKDTLVITKNETLTANFEPLAKYNLDVTVNDPLGGSVELLPAGGTYTEGDTVTVTATANVGYGFIRFGGAYADTTSSVKIVMTSGKELFVFFGKLYSLTINTSPSDDAGEVITFPKRDMYRDGDSVKLSVKSNSGFLFESWEGLNSSDKGVASDSVVTVVIGSNRIVIASFIRVYSFSVTMEPEDAGTLDFDLYPLKSYYVVGDTIKVIANSKSGYQFVGWEGAPAGAVVVGRIFNYVYGGTNRDNIELIAKFEPVESAPKRDGDLGYGDQLFLPYKKVTRGASDSRF